MINKKNMIRGGGILLIISIILTLFAGIIMISSSALHPKSDDTVFADSYNSGNGSTFYYNQMPGVIYNGIAYAKVDDTTAKVCGYSTDAGSIPANGAYEIESTVSIQGSQYDVVEIDDAFSGCTGLTSITIPGSVVSIGHTAFAGCTGLTSITLPGSVVSIGSSAFDTCTGLTSITLPGSVESIGVCAFAYCANLGTISVDVGNDYYVSLDGVLYTKDMETLVAYPSGKSGTTYNIPSGVQTIWWGAFLGSNLLEFVDIPDTVTEIGGAAFSNCGELTKVIIPSGVSYISSNTFLSCPKLKTIVVYSDNLELNPDEDWWWFFVDASSEEKYDDYPDGYAIYVPDDKVTYYKEDAGEGWAWYADVIQPLSSIPDGILPTSTPQPQTGVVADVVVPTIAVVMIVSLCVVLLNTKKGKKLIKKV